MSETALNTKYFPAENTNPFFDVHRSPLTADLNGSKLNVGRDALLTPDGDLLGVVSHNYKVVKNSDVRDLFDEFFNDFSVQSVTDKVSNGSGKWIREYILNDDKYVVNVGGDTVKTKAVVGNGYDGKTAAFMYLSAWRQVCSNGMMGWKNMIGQKFTHFADDILGKLGGIIDNNLSHMKDNFEIWEEWSKIPFNEKQFMGFVDDQKYLSTKQKDTTKALYLPTIEKYKEDETKWGAYNVLTAIATHHTSSRNKKVANEFSNGHRVMTRMAKNFYSLPDDYHVVAAA